ncbi:alpha-2,8-sialyltransferase 8E-like [Pelodytes ibericus]
MWAANGWALKAREEMEMSKQPENGHARGAAQPGRSTRSVSPYMFRANVKGNTYLRSRVKASQQHQCAKGRWETTSPFTGKRFQSCAVVGNGGILLNSCCGSEINKADFVFRFNLPPMNYSTDIGTKTDLITANPSIIHKSLAKLNERRKPLINMLKAYESALLLMPAFSFPSNTDVAFKVFYTLQDFESMQQLVYFNPKYLSNLATYWKNKGLKFRRLSSGIMIVSTALEMCDQVTLYGFWPFAQGTTGKPIPHHYYDNKIPKPGYHSMPDEFFFYSQMHSKGTLELKLKRCF